MDESTKAANQTTPNAWFGNLLLRFSKWLILGLSVWVGWNILAPYPHYMPPNFESGFLRGKQAFFYRNAYWLGFFAHIVAAPLALFFGAIQWSRTVLVRWPSVHRCFGRAYAILVLGFAAPGGLLMATRAYGGWSGAVCFSLIAVGAWLSTIVGWRAARRGEYAAHGRWMLRGYALILSAVFLRLINISLRPLEIGHELTYQISAWASGIVPLVTLEFLLRWWALRSTRMGSYITEK